MEKLGKEGRDTEIGGRQAATNKQSYIGTGSQINKDLYVP